MDRSIDLKVIISAVDEASSKLKSIQESASAMGKQFTVVGGILAGALGLATNEAIKAEAAQTRLSQILKTTQSASKEQVGVLFEQAKALERLGVVSETSVTIAQGQLATFDLQAKSIENLIPAVLNYAVAEKGAGVSTEELKALTNGLAQALQGNFASLTRTGFVLDEATKSLISNGTEAERVAALVKVLNSTYAGFNEAARMTAEGGLVALRNSLSQVAQLVGNVLLPIINTFVNTYLVPLIQKVIEWAEANPKLTETIVVTTAALAALLITLGPILMAFSMISPPILIATAVIAALTAGIYFLIQNWQAVSQYMAPVIEQVRTMISLVGEFLKPAVDFLVFALKLLWEQLKFLWEILQPILLPVLRLLATMFGATLVGAIAILIGSIGAIALVVASFIEGLRKLIDTLGTVAYWFMEALPAGLTFLRNAWETSWNAIKNTTESVVNFIQAKIDAVIAAWNRAQALVSAPIQAVGGAIRGAVTTVVSAVSGKRQEGGDVNAGESYLVGEKGAEIFTPNRAGTIIPNAGFGGINITITGNTFMSDERTALAIGDMIVNRLKMVAKLRV